MLCLMSLQENCTKTLFSSSKKRYHLDLLTKTFLLSLRASAEQGEHAGLSPVKGHWHRRKHDIHTPALMACFWDVMRKACFSQFKIKTLWLAEAIEVRNKAVPFPGKLYFSCDMRTVGTHQSCKAELHHCCWANQSQQLGGKAKDSF